MHTRHSDRSSRRPAVCSAAKMLGLFLFILGGKFRVMRMCSSSLPVFDQWEAEGRFLLRPWLRGELRFADLFAPWVQHRILWTRLLVLGLFRLNGQWDTQVEAIAAAVIHAGTAVLLGAILIRRLGRVWEDAILLCLLLLFALPFGMENTLSGGFESQFYTLLLFSVVAVWGMASHRAGSMGWWVGVAGAFLAWFSVATGGLPALSVAAWTGWRLARREGVPRENALTLAVVLALGIGGLCLSLGVGRLDALQPRSATEWLGRFAGLLGWPNPTAWAAPVAYAPFAWLLWQTWRHRQRIGQAEMFLIPLGFFCLLNTAALAYARNHYGGLDVSRYMDFLSIGTTVNFACLVLFVREARKTGTASARVRLSGLIAVWIVTTGFGLAVLTNANVVSDLPFVRAATGRAVESVAAFVARPDPLHLVRKDPYVFMCNDPALAEALLQDPAILPILPWQGRLPVVLVAASGSPYLHPATDDTGAPDTAGWRLEPSHDGRPVHFRSRSISGLRLPYLRFPEISEMGGNAFMCLVNERSGETTPLRQDPLRSGSQPVLVKTPDGPFHVEAVVAAGSNRSLTFAYPREVGWLSAWVDALLGSSSGFLYAGFVLWLGGYLLSGRPPGPGARRPFRDSRGAARIMSLTQERIWETTTNHVRTRPSAFS